MPVTQTTLYLLKIVHQVLLFAVQNKLLYWSDTNRNKIISSDFGGKRKKLVYSQYRYNQKIYGITFYKGRIYWTDG